MSTTQSKNLTVGSPGRVITGFTMPLLLSQLFQQLYNSVDSLIVGNYLGKTALAAVGSTGSLVFMLISLFAGIATGAGVVISRYYGAQDHETVSKAIHTNVMFALIAGVFLTVFGITTTPVILRWMGTAEDVMPLSVTYLHYYYMGALPMVMYNMLTGIMRALGDSRRPLYYLICSSLLNILLDYIFVAVLPFGVAGAAAATAIAQGVSMLLCLIALMRPSAEYRVRIRLLRMHRRLLGEIIRYGIPTGIQNSVISIANVLVQTNINSFGSDAMAACAAYSKLEGFAFLPITSYSMALTTFVGQNLGACEYDRARQGARFGIVTCVLMAAGIGIILELWPSFFISLFNSDEAVLAIGVRQIRTIPWFYALLSFSHCIAGVCRGAGKANVPMLVMLGSWCIFRICYITAAMRISHNIVLLFAAYPITWVISSVIFLIYYLKSDWVHGFEQSAKKHSLLHRYQG